MNSHISRVLLLALVAISTAWATESKFPLRVEASSSGLTPQGAEVVFDVTNISDQPISIYDVHVPWGLRINTLLVAVTKKNWEQIRAAGYAVEDPVSLKAIRILPGEKISGAVRLSEHVDYIELGRKKEDLLVFWYFKAKSTSDGPLGEYGGWLAIPFKNHPASPEGNSKKSKNQNSK